MLFWEDTVLATIDAAIVDARSGTPRILLFDGDQGSGRTAVLDEVISRSEGFQVEATLGDWHHLQVPFRGLGDWGVAGPDDDQSGSDKAGGGAAVPQVHFDGARELRTQIDHVTRNRPLLIVIDNIHWLDAESAEALTDVLSRSAGDRLLVAASTGIIAASELDTWQTLIATNKAIRRVHLDGLTLPATEKLVAAALLDAPAGLAADLWRRTGGSPLYLTFLLEHHDVTDLLSTPALPAPAEFIRELEGGYGRMGDDARRLASGMAVLGTGWMPLRDAAFVGEVHDPGGTAETLAKYFHIFLRPGRPGLDVKMRHSMTQAAAYQLIPAATLLRLHGRAATVVTDEVSEFEHLVASTATYDETLSRRLEAAAAKKEAAGTHRLATKYLAWAARVAPKGAERTRLWLGSLYEAVLAGDLLHVRSQLDTVRRSRDTARSALVIGMVLIADDHFTQAVQILREHTQDPQLDPLSRYRINVLLAWASMKAGDASTRVQEYLLRADDTGVRDDALIDQATLTAAIAGRREVVSSTVSQVAALPHELPIERTRRQAWRGCGAVLQGRSAEAITTLSRLEGTLGQEFLSFGGGLAEAFLGYAYWLEGDWDLADVRFRAAEALLDGSARPMMSSLIAIGHVGRGRFDLADELLQHARDALVAEPWAEAINLYIIATVVRAIASNDALQQQTLLQTLRDDFGMDITKPAVAVGPLWTEHAVLLSLWAGERDDARRLLDTLEDDGSLSPRIMDVRAWLHDAAASDTLKLKDAAPFLGGISSPTDTAALAAPTEKAVADNLGISSKPKRALERLEDVASGRPTAVDLGGATFAALSDRERDVAALLVAGMSYAQIAQNLYVTRSTVGFHLGKIYAKTGTTSRHELADLVRSE